MPCLNSGRSGLVDDPLEGADGDQAKWKNEFAAI
jgi:hypothetical protein